MLTICLKRMEEVVWEKFQLMCLLLNQLTISPDWFPAFLLALVWFSCLYEVEIPFWNQYEKVLHSFQKRE